jgi:hypothetical protein
MEDGELIAHFRSSAPLLAKAYLALAGKLVKAREALEHIASSQCDRGERDTCLARDAAEALQTLGRDGGKG